MIPSFLVPEQVVRQNGTGPVLDLGVSPPSALTLTLGITRILEQESIDLAIWASTDGQNFGDKPVTAFPQKFYCGVYSVTLDLTACPDARYLRAEWKLNRWGRGEPTPLFGLYVAVEQSAPAHLAVAS
jgi:hypothetical protein